MADAKFTPGPWSFTKCPCGDRGCNQFTISTQGSVGFDEANARLIAAAPDLYEALSEALDMIVDACRDGNYSVSQFNRLKATLAKARGQ